MMESPRSTLEFGDGLARLEGFEPPTFWSVARRSIRAELEALIENRSVRSSVRMLKLNNVVWRRGWDSNPRTA